MAEMERRQSETFVVKVLSGDGAELTGQVQHVITGEKYRFQGLEELGSAIAHMRRRAGRDQPARPDAREREG